MLGDFRIVRELGRGGMGIVYEAEQLSLNRRVALKILPTAAVLDPRTLQRFKNEAQAAAALDHPHIVDVYGIGSERCVHYYAMRLIDGCTLAEVIADIGNREQGTGNREGEAPPEPSPANPKSKFQNRKSASTAPLALLSTVRTANKSAFFRMVAELGIHVADGLHHAHEQGVVHRDIKPSNLMLDGQGKVWITDFGLAQIETSPGLTHTGDLLGTLRYMSPEQTLANRAPIDHRSDIYSLGATLYELLTLQPVFGESNRSALLQQIALRDPTPPRKLNPQIPADLETILLKMLEKDPRSRYASAADLAAELTRFVENKPITARRPSLRQRLAKWSARNSTLVTTVAVAMLAFATIVGGILGWWSRDNAAQHLVIERVATEALQSAEQFGKQANWPQSLSELKRAEAAFAAHPIRSALLSQILAGQKDAAMALRLDEIRLQAAMVAGSDFDFSSADAAYQAAFDAYGIPVAKLSPAEAAREVRASQIREELAAALTDWSIVRMRMNGKRTADSHLLNVARQADPDPWRGRLRKEWKRDELIEMATSPALEKQSPATLFLFVTAAMHQRANDEPMQTKLRQIQRLHTNDFWLNFALARYFENTEPPQWDEAVRYYSVTLGLRPDAAAAHNNVGVALHKQGRRSEAIAEYRRAIELQPEFTAPRLNLGLAVADEPQVRPAAD